MSFDFAAAIRRRPSGDTQAQLVAAYGNPEGLGASASAQGPAWFNPSPQWVRDNIVRVPLADLPGWPPYPGASITGVSVHRLVAPVLAATWGEVCAAGLAGELKTFNGALASRHMGHNRDRPLSVHAFGAAVDFDAAWNGYGVPIERMGINRDVVRIFEECGWTWGGRWTGEYADGMHFQWTDPLAGVKVADWQDARGRAPAAPVVITPKPTPVVVPQAPEPRRVVLSQFGGEFQDISGARVEITGAERVVINATDPLKVQVRVER
ncbi:M15 family metallopeptidase [Deinococcus hohokamensis]|uniref:M15 family metallopeptidase n=1 Tax=Deinococcus hohokamensis TaxID=309883 RepID=A0ABV9IDM0_9DEIO